MPIRRSVFVDTSGWADPLVQNSPDSQAMTQAYRQLIAARRPFVTTNYVLAELVALLTTRTRFTRPQILTMLDRIRSMRQLTLIFIDAELDRVAWDMLRHYDDKLWSLVDASSFVVMQRLAIQEALTTDHHFTQAGFVRIP